MFRVVRAIRGSEIEEDAPSAPPESRIDDVVEDRSEGIVDAEVEEVLVAREELALAEEDVLGGGGTLRQVDLIPRARVLAEHVEREPIEQPDVRTAENAERVLCHI